MSPRLLALVTFFVVALAASSWGGRRDRMAGAPFALPAPAGFTQVDRREAAAAIGGADVGGLAEGGALYMHYAVDDEDRAYTEVVEASEDSYQLRTGPSDVEGSYGEGVVVLGGQTLKVLEAGVVRLGPHEVIRAKLAAKVGERDVRLTRYSLPTDAGEATVEAWCLASEEARYAPGYDATIAAATGVARRPGRAAWYVVGAVAAVAAALAYVGAARRRARMNATPPVTPLALSAPGP